MHWGPEKGALSYEGFGKTSAVRVTVKSLSAVPQLTCLRFLPC